MTTTQTTDPARAYLDRVRALLADLPEEERAELVQDLAAHLDELAPDRIETELGTPEAFVAEFRTTAGLGTGPSDRSPGLVDRLAGRARALRRHPLVVRVNTVWPEVRPVWVGIRGWLLVALLATLYTDRTAFRNFPLPLVEPSPIGGILAVAIATALSVAAVRRADAGSRMWRGVTAVFDLTVAWLLLVSLVGGTLYTWAGVQEGLLGTEQRVRDDVDMLLPRDLTATTPDGERLDAVLLFDETGRQFDLARIRWELGLAWPYTESLEAGRDQAHNRYPIGEPIPRVDRPAGVPPVTTTTLLGG